MAKSEKLTIRQLKKKLKEVGDASTRWHKDYCEATAKATQYKKDAEVAREQFADLKKRLHNSETECARINGYLARVREDDTVREELISVGEPGGHQQLVPKRKPEHLANRHSDLDDMLNPRYDELGRRKEKSKHWIEY